MILLINMELIIILFAISYYNIQNQAGQMYAISKEILSQNMFKQLMANQIWNKNEAMNREKENSLKKIS